jgi:hypothetical protein
MVTRLEESCRRDSWDNLGSYPDLQAKAWAYYPGPSRHHFVNGIMSAAVGELFAQAREKRVEAMAIIRISHALSHDPRRQALDAQAADRIATAEALEAEAARLQHEQA